MIGLFGQLHLGSESLRAHQLGLQVTGHNIANVSTPGYSRRRLVLSEATPANYFPAGQIGQGVAAGPVEAMRSKFLEIRYQLEKATAAGDQAVSDLLAGVEAVFSEEQGFGFQEELSAFFNAFSDLSSQPESLVYREQVLGRTQALIDRMQGAHGQLEQMTRDIDSELERLVTEANALMERIASLNEQIPGTEAISEHANQQRDERAALLVELSELLEVTHYENADGAVSVTLRDGTPLVVGSEVQSLQTARVGPGGRVSIMHGSTDVTSLILTGKAGGLLAVRDTFIPDYQRSLDTLALTLMDEVNTLHRAGFALDGVTTGNDLFAPFTPPGPGDPTGAVNAMAIDSGIVADSTLLAAAGAPNAPGDGSQAQAISDLRDARVLGGGTTTLSGFYSEFVYQLGSDAQDARFSAEASQAVADQVERQKLSVAGVSLDEEAVALIEYQRAYEASARFIRVVDELTQVALGLGAG